MQRLLPDHLPAMIAALDGAGASSYVCLASVHGYSASEIRAAWDADSAVHFADDPHAPRLLLSVDAVDRANSHARVQFFGEAALTATTGLAEFMGRLRSALGVARLCSHIFAGEAAAAALLRALGFTQEARFREHVFMNGAYHDVLVFGWDGSTP